MYVLVQHYISEPRTFWSDVSASLSALPKNLRLHHCFPTPDGSHAVCVWEADALRDVRAFIEAYVGHVSRNVYFPVENMNGVAAPSDIGGKPALEN